MQYTRRSIAHPARPTLHPRAPFPQIDLDHLGRPATTMRHAPSNKDEDDDDDDNMDSDSHGKTITKRRKKTKTMSATSSANGAGADGVMFAGWATANTPTFDTLARSGIPDSGGSPSLVQAVATGSPSYISRASASPKGGNSDGGGLSPVALYCIIGGAALAGLIVLTSGIICCLRRRRARASAAWPGYTPSGAFIANGTEIAVFPGPGKGPGARGEMLRDDASMATLEKHGFRASVASTPVDEKHPFPLDIESGPQTPRLQQQQSAGQDAQLTPSHPDYKPPRPPRPNEQISFTNSPIKTVTHNVQLSQHQQQGHARSQSRAVPGSGLDAYQRNLLALTKSMSFEGPLYETNMAVMIDGVEAGKIARSPFADPAGLPTVQRKASRKLNDPKKDTLIVSIITRAAMHGSDQKSSGARRELRGR